MPVTLVVEDGTGLETANVYDLSADCSSFLADRSATFAPGASFVAGISADQDQWLLEATNVMERASVDRVIGFPFNGDDQAMLYPRTLSQDRRFRRHLSDERPASYREGIFFLSGDMALAGSAGLVLADPGIEEESGPAGSIEYRDGERSLSERYPTAFRRAAEAFPSGVRADRR